MPSPWKGADLALDLLIFWLVCPPLPETSGGHVDFPLSILCLDHTVLEVVLPRPVFD